MIALKSVKTLPATMLEVEREEVSGGGPSLRRRAAASWAESPCSVAASITAPCLPGGPAAVGCAARKPVQ